MRLLRGRGNGADKIAFVLTLIGAPAFVVLTDPAFKAIAAGDLPPSRVVELVTIIGRTHLGLLSLLVVVLIARFTTPSSPTKKRN